MQFMKSLESISIRKANICEINAKISSEGIDCNNLFIYLLQYNYKLYSNYIRVEHMLGVVSQCSGSRTHDPHGNSLAY